jgi:TRAP-type C4-dicarboxylate transport system substrate-binding protein
LTIPPDVQKVFLERVPTAEKVNAEVIIPNAEKNTKIALDYGNKIYTPRTEEKALWDKIGVKVEEKWIADMNAAGITGAPELLTRWKQLAAASWK